jgi:hypothetical protein
MVIARRHSVRKRRAGKHDQRAGLLPVEPLRVGNLNPLLAFALTALIIEITTRPNTTYLAALSNGACTGFALVDIVI